MEYVVFNTGDIYYCVQTVGGIQYKGWDVV